MRRREDRGSMLMACVWLGQGRGGGNGGECRVCWWWCEVGEADLVVELAFDITCVMRKGVEG